MKVQFAVTVLLSSLLPSVAWSVPRQARLVRKCERTAMAGVTSLQAVVQSVSDGDTMSVTFPDGATGRVRLLGIDAPETHYMGQSQGPAGDEAMGALQGHLPVGTPIVIEFDKEACDMYGRFLGFVGRPASGGGTIDINAMMISQGYALPYCFRAKMTRCQPYTQMGVAADKAGLNIFKRYQIELPDVFRRRISDASKQAPLPLEPMVEHQ